jgi:hypothetical protein
LDELHQTAAPLAKVCGSKGFVLLSVHNEQRQEAPRERGSGGKARLVPEDPWPMTADHPAASIMLRLPPSVLSPTRA